MTVTQAHFVEPIRHPEAKAFRDNPRIHHPELGWGVVSVISDGSIRLRFEDEGVFAWFSLDDEVFATWPVERAGALASWVLRATRR